MPIEKKQKLLVILGPTSSGKSELAIRVAQKFHGEVVSADSRQVYKNLNIATGKVTDEEMQSVPHHLLSVVDPKEVYTSAEFKIESEKAIQNIIERDKLPILCGGTGFYIGSIVDNILYPDVPPNKELRESLEEKETEELFEILKEKDGKRAKTIDPKNRVRLIRAIEIARALGSVPEVNEQPPKYETLQIGLTVPDNILKHRIKKRTLDRMEKGMIEEAKTLHAQGLSLLRMKELGLEYRILAEYLEGTLTEDEVVERIKTENWQYAKRQVKWFKRDGRIHWISFDHPEEAFTLVNNFLQNKNEQQ